jgi:hypothetical protein
MVRNTGIAEKCGERLDMLISLRKQQEDLRGKNIKRCEERSGGRGNGIVGVSPKEEVLLYVILQQLYSVLSVC